MKEIKNWTGDTIKPGDLVTYSSEGSPALAMVDLRYPTTYHGKVRLNVLRRQRGLSTGPIVAVDPRNITLLKRFSEWLPGGTA